MPHLTLDGDPIHYQEKGTGPAVVLLHGFPLDLRIWDAQAAALSDRNRVITIDLRGFGQSRSTRSFTMQDLADDVHHVLTHIQATPAVLGGLSMGGYVTLAYMVKYPTDLRGVMLIDTKAEADTADGKAGRMKMIELVKKEGAKAVADQMMPKMLSPDTPPSRPDVVGRLREIMEACPPLTIEHALLALRDRPDQTDKLASCACPTLIVVGESDAITPPAAAQAMQKEIPHAKLAVIKAAGHMSPMEQPEQVSRAMKEFLGTV